MTYRFDGTESGGRRRGIERASASVLSGELVVFPVDAAYGLGCDAFNEQATARLRGLKGHSRAQPPPVLIGRTSTVDGIATGLSAAARDLMDAFWPGPLTLICRSQPTLSWDLGDDGGRVAVRVPLHPIALELLQATGPMAVTGANPGGDPTPPTSCFAVREVFGDQVECYIDAGELSSAPALASTIVDVSGEVPRIIRAGSVTQDELLAVVPAWADQVG